jgi:outer membrane protein assembly factor BamA
MFFEGTIVTVKFKLHTGVFFFAFLISHVLSASYVPIQTEIDSTVAVSSPPQDVNSHTSTIEPLPIASYDTDVGVGYGAKCFFLNQLGLNESFDCVAFNSTKGERWYRFVFSLPDFELRQGKTYPAAADVIVDYDKMIKNSFFGIGNRSQFGRREYYTREPLDASITLSKGYSPTVVVQEGIRFKSVRNFNFQDTSLFYSLPPANSSTAIYQSLFVNFRYDTRNSFVNPSLGSVVEVDVEKAVHTSFNNSQFTKLSLSLQYYSTLISPATIIALRCMGQGVVGSDLPVQVLSSVGGNTTVRGSPQDRFLYNMDAVINAELRFPILWRIGGVAGFDAGKVWHALTDIDLVRWAANPVAGLRLYMETFVVRLDVGFGQETTGVYFNFGQLF